MNILLRREGVAVEKLVHRVGQVGFFERRPPAQGHLDGLGGDLIDHPGTEGRAGRGGAGDPVDKPVDRCGRHDLLRGLAPLAAQIGQGFGRPFGVPSFQDRGLPQPVGRPAGRLPAMLVDVVGDHGLVDRLRPGPPRRERLNQRRRYTGDLPHRLGR